MNLEILQVVKLKCNFPNNRRPPFPYPKIFKAYVYNAKVTIEGIYLGRLHAKKLQGQYK